MTSPQTFCSFLHRYVNHPHPHNIVMPKVRLEAAKRYYYSIPETRWPISVITMGFYSHTGMGQIKLSSQC